MSMGCIPVSTVAGVVLLVAGATSGWRYTTMDPKTDLVLRADGKEIVVQDEIENTYQKLN